MIQCKPVSDFRVYGESVLERVALVERSDQTAAAGELPPVHWDDFWRPDVMLDFAMTLQYSSLHITV